MKLMKGDKVFLDTNIIIYAYDAHAGEKHRIAKKIFVELWDSGLGVISTQVLQEFFVNVTQKIPKILDKRLVKGIVSDLLKWDVVVNDGESVIEAIEILLRYDYSFWDSLIAIEILLRYDYSFWDSLIIEAAIRSGAVVLLSEDLSHGQIIHGVTIKNPFKTEPLPL
ncbi:MAG: PIN domain-containing protein [Deltaproteobacteria bacterium]|nr:PIN domain-containing protein [Deltaproteobacteria bacterium]